MSADITTVVVAVLGVSGTLASPILGQRIAARARQQEFDLQHREDLASREDKKKRLILEERRSTYAALNTAARRYAEELRAFLRLLSAQAVTDEARSELLEARRSYRDLYSDAQMIVPDDVLSAAALVSEALGDAYGLVNRLAGDAVHGQAGGSGTPSIEAASDYVRVTVHDRVTYLRELMRADLHAQEPTPDT